MATCRDTEGTEGAGWNSLQSLEDGVGSCVLPGPSSFRKGEPLTCLEETQALNTLLMSHDPASGNGAE